MRKRVLSFILTVVMVAGSGVVANAAPERMADGTVFDAEYYAQQYPDVVAVFGTDAGLLYQHYQKYGKAEGRKPAADGAQATVPINIADPAGDYKVGSVYGPRLTKKELAEVKEAVKVFLSRYDFSTMNDYQKVEAAHDYIVAVCEYAPDWRYNGANTAWGALVYGEAQCSGYARAMKALCDAMGVGCYYVHADENASNPSHQWNEVCIDGKWYIIDVQGNDKYESRVAYLLSDNTYAYNFRMSWDKSIVPACPENYDKTIEDSKYGMPIPPDIDPNMDPFKLLEMGPIIGPDGRTYFSYAGGWITYDR